MYIALAILLALLLFVFWLTTFVGLPGNWLMLLCTLLYMLVVPSESVLAVGWIVLAILAVLAILGEIMETAFSAVAASKVGGSRRGAALSLVGSIVGGVLGVFAPIPIPVVGSVIGALVCAGLGAFIGAMIGEQWKGKSLDDSVNVGTAAFAGRILGSLGKAAAGFAMLIVVIVGLCVEAI